MAEKPDDLNLPISVVGKLIKETLPEGVSIAKEAKIAVAKAASIFILYATSSAFNFSDKNKRKTLSSQDVLSAMEEMEFDQFLEPLKKCLETFKEGQQMKRSVAEKRRRSKAKESEGGAPQTEADADADIAGDDDAPGDVANEEAANDGDAIMKEAGDGDKIEDSEVDGPTAEKRPSGVEADAPSPSADQSVN